MKMALVSDLVDAIRARDWVRAMARLSSHPGEANIANQNGWLPLHYPCWKQAPLAVVQALLHAHPAAASTPTVEGHLPLHMAAYNQAPLEVVQLLLRTYPEGASTASNNGCLPLHSATLFNTPASVEVVAALLAEHPEAALAYANDGRLPNLTRYPAVAIAAALRAQVAARRRPAMLAWRAARM